MSWLPLLQTRAAADYDTDLIGAQELLAAELEDGRACPCCGQFAKVYKRKINSGMARALVLLYKDAGTDWVHKPSVLRQTGGSSRDESLLRFWGLLEPGLTTGWWRVTTDGQAFVRGQLSVRRWAWIYDGECFAVNGPPTTIREALGSHFDLDALMSNQD